MATFALPTEAETSINCAWQTALDEWKAAYALAQRLSKELDAVTLAFDRLRPDLSEIEGTIKRRFPGKYVRVVALTEDIEGAWERMVNSQGRLWWGRDLEEMKAKARADYDAILAWRVRYERAAHVTGHDSVNEEHDAAWDLESEARSRLMKTPAGDCDGATLKLDLLFGADVIDSDGFCESWTADWVLPAIADAKRFLERAA